MKISFAALLCAVTLFAHTTKPAGQPPSDLDPAIASVLQKDGISVLDGDKVVSELWFRSALPTGGKTNEENVSLSAVPHGALLGVIRFPERGADRRGQAIKPGVYTLRLSFFPPNGEHQGIAPQRDFLILSPAAIDKDPKATPDFAALMDMSRKASGTAHPAVLSAWKAEADSKPGIVLEGEHDQVLRTKIGDTLVAVVVVGKSDH